MTKREREKVLIDLRDIWDRREVAHIPHHSLRRLSDPVLSYLLRFWTHKDRHWADLDNPFEAARQPDFTEEPPKGWKQMRIESSRIVTAKPGRPVKLSLRPTRMYGRRLVLRSVVNIPKPK